MRMILLKSVLSTMVILPCGLNMGQASCSSITTTKEAAVPVRGLESVVRRYFMGG